MNRFRRFVAVGHGFHQRGGSENHVTAGKHARRRGRERCFRGDFPVGQGHAREVRLLADGENDGIRGHDEVGALNGHGAAAAAFVRLAEGHVQAFQPADIAVAVGHDPAGVGQQFECDAFLCGLGDFFGQGGHLGAAATVNDGDLNSAEAEGGPGRVHGDVAAADDRDPLADGNRLAQVGLAEEVQAVHDPLGGVAGEGDRLTLVSARRDEDRAETLGAQVVDGDVGADLGIQADFDPVVEQLLDLEVEHVPRQTIGGHAQPQHSAQERPGLEDRHAITQRA